MRNLTLSQRAALGFLAPNTIPNFREVRRAIIDFKSGQIVHDVKSGPLPDGQREVIDHQLVVENDSIAIYAARIQVKLNDQKSDPELGENLELVSKALIEDATLMKAGGTTEYATEALGLLGLNVDGQDRQIGKNWALVTIVVDKTTGEYSTGSSLNGSLELVADDIMAFGHDKSLALASVDEVYNYLTDADSFQTFNKMVEERGSMIEFTEPMFLTRCGYGKVLISNGQNTKLYQPIDIGDGNFRLEPAAQVSGIVLANLKTDEIGIDNDNVILLDNFIDGADPNQVTTHTVSPVDILGDDFATAYRKPYQATMAN